jgi:hypothetical protein
VLTFSREAFQQLWDYSSPVWAGKLLDESYGFRTYRVLELALYQLLGKLPEPESTHDFF